MKFPIGLVDKYGRVVFLTSIRTVSPPNNQGLPFTVRVVDGEDFFIEAAHEGETAEEAIRRCMMYLSEED